MKEIKATISEIFQAIEELEHIKFKENEEYFQKTKLQVKDENNNWVNIKGLITKKDKIRNIKFNSGEEIKVADKHKIFNGKKCIMVHKLQKEDKIINSKGIELKVTSNILTNKIDVVYDMEIDNKSHLYQTYDNIIHHNSYLTIKLAEQMFGNKDNLVRLDMSEYGEKHSVSKLIGAPAGYIGYDEHQGLTEKVRHKPYSIVLLDEIEKAHPDIWDLFLQLFDEGHMTDSTGIKVDFKNTIIIMTSNVGTKELASFGAGIGFKTKDSEKISSTKDIKHKIIKSLEKAFKPEFINRIDDIIVFNILTPDDLLKIVELELIKVQKRIEELGYFLKITKQAMDFLILEGYDENKGARELKRIIQKLIEDPVAELILNNLKKGSHITGDYKKSKNEIVFKVI